METKVKFCNASANGLNNLAHKLHYKCTLTHDMTLEQFSDE